MSEEKEPAKSKGGGIPKTRLNYNDPMILLEIEGYARDGFGDEQIAELMDVAPQTFSKAKNKKQADGSKSELSDALTRGRRPLNVLVENAMYKSAMGGAVTKTVTTSTRQMYIRGKIVQITDTITTETEQPANVKAQETWLRFRKAEIYNQQPTRSIDITTAGKELPSSAPRITHIEHVIINSDDVIKNEVDV